MLNGISGRAGAGTVGATAHNDRERRKLRMIVKRERDRDEKRRKVWTIVLAE
jgi:hypothetical protein